MVSYNLEVYQFDPSVPKYTRIGEIITYQNLEWNKVSSQINYLKFSLNVYDKANKFIIPHKNFILLKRNGIAERFYEIVDVKGNINSNSGSLNIYCYDLLWRLTEKRYVEGNYINTRQDAGSIASDLISNAQTGTNRSLNIQNGFIDTIGESNETLFFQSVGKALINMSDNINGFYFDFVPILDANKILDYIQFNVYKSVGQLRNNLPPFELGFSVNILNFGIKNFVTNKVFALGNGTGDVEIAESENIGSRDVFGVMEGVNKYPSVRTKNTLQDKANQFINNNNVVNLELAFSLTEGVKPYYGDFGLFDTIPVQIQIANTFFNFKGNAQINELTFSYNNNENKETCSPIITYYKSVS